jgi:predicted dehydrogenase
MNISIIGAGRKRNGIGQYIAKFLNHHGARVTSVLGTSEETSKDASRTLQKYGIESAPYTDFRRMVDQERPDAVVIASPSPTHYDYLAKSIDLGLHIFCEKPFIWPGYADTREKVDEILKKVKEKKLILAMNSQWPFAWRFYQQICGEIEIKKSTRFFIQMAPFTSGKEMIPESVPHALSLLYASLGEGQISELRFKSPKKGEMVITFQYVGYGKDCGVQIQLARKEEQPRDFCFGFNDKIVKRSLDFQTYAIYFECERQRLNIADPLELSVQNFMEAVEKKVEPLIGGSHILSNMSLLKEIYDCYEEN